ncbi:unnamed protein product [Ostreobium quekettii]|uniref:Uncharacterized protein n=1 Tax=Ostreobium quekettii TaxID=121088 RepID=A0A8S1JAN9_9CHLO|nr:unnamed protein product [Ostreobium quekettii]
MWHLADLQRMGKGESSFPGLFRDWPFNELEARGGGVWTERGGLVDGFQERFLRWCARWWVGSERKGSRCVGCVTWDYFLNLGPGSEPRRMPSKRLRGQAHRLDINGFDSDIVEMAQSPSTKSIL